MYSSDKNINNIMTSLNHGFAILSNWFYKNFMVLSPDKCSYMLFGVMYEVQTDLTMLLTYVSNILDTSY